MSTNKRKGSESTWHVVRRCLAMARRLQRGPATKQELLAAVYTSEGEEAYGHTAGEDLNNRFENDKDRLRKKLHVQVEYDKWVKGYVIAGQDRPLLDLPDSHLQTLAFLADTFQADSPNAPQVQQLIDTLLAWLPVERQRFYQKARGVLPDVELRLRDSEEIAPDVWEAILEAHNARQQLQFDYLSSQHADGIKRQHLVEPWYFYFSNRGHWRLRAYCLFNDGPHGPWSPNDYMNYRVSRIVPGSARVLPKKLGPYPPRGKPRDAIYELAPEIARFGVSHRPELTDTPRITEMDEGWVRVEGQTHDVFELARNLLYYGPNCRVLGGRELLEETRRLVRGLWEMYP